MFIGIDKGPASDVNSYMSMLTLTPPSVLLRMLTRPFGEASGPDYLKEDLSACDIVSLVQQLGTDKAARLLCNASGETRSIGFARLPAGFPDDCYPRILQMIEQAVGDLKEAETARSHDVTSIENVGHRSFFGSSNTVSSPDRGRLVSFLLGRRQAPVFIGADTDVYLRSSEMPTFEIRIDFKDRDRLLQEIDLLVDRELSLMDEGTFRSWTAFSGDDQINLPALTGPLDSFAADCVKHLHATGLSFIRQVLVDWMAQALYSVLLDVPYGRFLYDEEGCPSTWLYHTGHRRAVSAAVARFTNPAFSDLVTSLAISGPFGGCATIKLVSGPQEHAYEEAAKFISLLSAMEGVHDG